LIIQQIFKENRWWWSVGVQSVFGGSGANKSGKEAGKDGQGAAGADPEYNEDEEADEDEMQARAGEKSAAAEDFREQNMIWT
jgi:hypothetical protein